MPFDPTRTDELLDLFVRGTMAASQATELAEIFANVSGVKRYADDLRDIWDELREASKEERAKWLHENEPDVFIRLGKSGPLPRHALSQSEALERLHEKALERTVERERKNDLGLS